MLNLSLFAHRNNLFFACLLLLLSSCDAVLSKYETYKRVNYNPYESFYESIDCECRKNEVVSPQLRLIEKSSVHKSEKNTEIILASTESFSKTKNIYIRYNINQCGIITFKSNDIVIVKGQMFFESLNHIIEPVSGYIELNGKKYCVD